MSKVININKKINPAGLRVRFTVDGTTLTVTAVEPEE